MADQNVQLAILLEVRQALQNMQEFEKQAAQSVSNTEKAFASLKGIAAAVVASFAVKEIRDFASESVKAASDQEAAQKRLSTALALTGDYSDDAFHSMVEFADQLEKTSRFSDGTITAQLAVAKSFGASNEQAKLLVQTAADMASQLGTDLPEQVEKLGKSLSGNAGRLAQNYAGLGQFSEAQLKAGAAIEYLGARFRGAAENDIHTYEGATLQAHNAVEDLQKSLGHLVTDSPIALARIGASTKAFQGMADWVEANKDELQHLVDDGFKALVLAGPAAVDVTITLAKAFEVLGEGGALAVAELIHIVGGMGQVFNDTFGDLISDIIDFLSTIASLAEAIPGVGTAMETLGFKSDGLSKSIEGIREGFDGARHGAVNAAEEMENSIFSFVDGADQKFEEFNGVADAFSLKMHESAQTIIDADADATESGKRAVENRKDYNNQVGRSAKDTAKLLQDLARLDEKLLKSETDPLKKATEEHDQFVAEVKRLENERIIDSEGAQDRLTEIERIYADKREKIAEDEWKQKEGEAKEALGEIQKDVQGLSTNPVAFVISYTFSHESNQEQQAEIESIMADGTTDGVLAGMAIATSALQGQNGLKNFVVDAFKGIPVFGPALSGLMQFALQDPATVKAQAKAWADAIPLMVEEYAQAGPAMAEGFADSMLSSGAIVRMAEAWGDFFVYGPWFRAAGKILGINFGDSLSAQRIGPTIAREWHKDMDWIDAVGPKIGKAIEHSFTTSIDGLQKEGDKLRIGFAQAPQQIERGFHDGVTYLETRGPAAFAAGATTFLGAIEKGGKDLFAGFAQPFASAGKTFVGALADTFKTTFGSFHFPEITIPKIETPAWIQPFVDAVKDLTHFGGLTTGGGGGGGLGGVAGKAASIIGGVAHHARGISEVPSGYGNDDYFAGLTSGEGVVDAETNPGLKKMAADYAAGKLTASTDVLLARVIALLEQPMTVQTTAQVDRRAFADIQLQLSRQNARTA